MSNGHQQNTALNNRGDWRPWEMDELASTPKINQPTVDLNSPPTSIRTEPDISPNLPIEEEKRKGYAEGLEAGRKEGYEAGLLLGKTDGYAQGLKEGQDKAAKDLSLQIGSTLTPLTQLVQSFEEAITLLDTDITAELVELALAVGCQLARDQLDEQPELVLDVVQELLHMEPSINSKPRLWLHPEDLELVERHLGDEFLAAGWRLQPDKQLSRGGCKLTSTNEEYDATWETRCRLILSQVRQRRAPGPNVVGLFPQ